MKDNLEILHTVLYLLYFRDTLILQQSYLSLTHLSSKYSLTYHLSFSFPLKLALILPKSNKSLILAHLRPLSYLNLTCGYLI